MKQIFKRWFDVYEDEIALFLWTAILLFLIRSSGIVLNNYAETVFLKRYGVQYLPIVNMANAVATFIIMGFVAGIIVRNPGAKLLGWLFMFCGITVAGIRALIPFNIDLIYPLLFMLKSQYEVLLALLFWNLANDLFNTRQSKRIFPMVTAGGVIGQILGSFGTPWLARTFSLDDLLYVYLVLAVLGAVTVKAMSMRFPSKLFSEKIGGAKGKKRASMIDEIRKIRPMLKESLLIKIMIVLTFMPNVAIPIMNYQFNFAVNEQFASESGLLEFFGYFRGALNIVSLIILMFVGKIYGRWGLPVALMFHPFNYLMVFLAFLFRFDAFTAMYARLTANVLRTTINIPAMAVVTGLFPEEYRSVVRPFLRGTVVRLALFLGSGLILLSTPLFHPRYLSLVALPFVLVWLMAPFILKRRYAQILLDLVSRKMLDLKSLELKDVGHLFKDKSIHDHIVKAFRESRGRDSVWYGQLLAAMGSAELDRQVLDKLKTETDETTRIDLLDMLPANAGDAALPVLKELAAVAKPAFGAALIRAAGRVAPQDSVPFIRHIYETAPDRQVKARALGVLYPDAPQVYGPLIGTWLESEDPAHRHAGVIAAGNSGEPTYVEHLQKMLDPAESGEIICALLKGLGRLKAPALNQTVRPYLNHTSEAVRREALQDWEIIDDESLRSTISFLGDASDELHDIAKAKIQAAEYHSSAVLMGSLSIAKRKIHKGIFEIIESLSIKDIEIIRFAKAQIEKGYQLLAGAHCLQKLPQSPVRGLLQQHFEEMSRRKVDDTIRILATQDPSGRMKVIWRSIFSADSDQRGNSVEALDDIIDTSLSKIIIPLVDDMDTESRLAHGRKHFKLMRPEDDSERLIRFLFGQEDWPSIVLALSLIAEMDLDPIDPEWLQPILKIDNARIKQIVDPLLASLNNEQAGKEMEMANDLPITEKILHLKKIDIFEDLAVGELAAVASVTEMREKPEAEIVIREGNLGENLYLLIDGEVSVIKGFETEQELQLARIRASDYFGEMALFEDETRSATIKTEKPSTFLVLHKREFKEIVKEYPTIALQACKVLSGRMRKFQQKVAECGPGKVTS